MASTSTVILGILFAELLILSAASSLVVSVSLAFVIGFCFSLVLVFLVFFLGLDTADRYFEKKKSKYVDENKKTWNTSQLAGPPSQLQSEIMLLVRPQNKDRVTTWYKATLKNNLLQFQETKPLVPDEPKKGTILTDDLKITVVRTKKGSLWKKTNYLEIAHESRVLLGEAKSLYLFFRTRREMEEWYYALTQSVKFHDNESENPSLAAFRVLSSKFNPGLGAPLVEAPWFNALAQRLFYQYSSDPMLLEFIQKKINKQFDKISKPDFIKALEVLEVKLDSALPIFENFQLLQVSPSGAVKLATDVKYGGGFYMKINVVIETPKILDWIDSKILPAVLSARIRGLSGKLVLHLAAPPSDRLWLGFDGEPEIDMKVETEIDLGMENKTFSISNQFPKLSKIIRTILRREIVETTLLPEMEDIPLPKIGKDAVRDELSLDVPIVQRWESDEAQKKAEEAARKVEEKKKDSKIVKEKAGQLHNEAISEEAIVKEAVVSHLESVVTETSSPTKKSLRQKLFGPKDSKPVEPTPLPEPIAPLEAKEELTFGEALNNIDDALTSFLGSFAGNADGNKTKAALVSDAASAAAQDVKNKVSSLLFGDLGGRPSSPVKGLGEDAKELSSVEKKRRSSGSAPTSSSVPPPRPGLFVSIPTHVVLPSSLLATTTSDSPPTSIAPLVEAIAPVPDSADLPPAPSPVVKEIDDIFGTSPSKPTSLPPTLPTFDEVPEALPEIPQPVPVVSPAPIEAESKSPSLAPSSAPLEASVLGMSVVRVIEDYTPPDPSKPPSAEREAVLSRPADQDDFGYISSSDDDVSASPKPSALLFSPPRKVSKPTTATPLALSSSAAPPLLEVPVEIPLLSASTQSPSPAPIESVSPSPMPSNFEDDIFGGPPPVVPPRPAVAHPGLSTSVSRPANQWSASAGEKPLPQIPSSKPAEKQSRNPFKGLFGSTKKTNPEDSTLGSLKTSIIGLGDRVGSEHTGIASLDSALDSVFGSLSSKAKELSETSPRKKK